MRLPKLSLKMRILVALAAIALVCIAIYYVPRFLSVRTSFDEAAWNDATRILADEVGAQAVEKGSFSIPRIPVGAPYEGLLLDIWESPDEKLLVWSFVQISPHGGHVAVFANTNPVSALPDVVSIPLSREEAVRVWKTIRYLWWVRCSRNGAVAANGADARSRPFFASWTWPKPDAPLRFEMGKPSSCSGMESDLAWSLSSRFIQDLYRRAGPESRGSVDRAGRLLLPDLRRLVKGRQWDSYLAAVVFWQVSDGFCDRSALPAYRELDKQRVRFNSSQNTSAIVRWLSGLPLLNLFFAKPGNMELPDSRTNIHVLEHVTDDRALSLSEFLGSFSSGPGPIGGAANLDTGTVFLAALKYLVSVDRGMAKKTFVEFISREPAVSNRPSWIADVKAGVITQYEGYFGRDPDVARILSRDKDPAVSLCAKCVLFAFAPEEQGADGLDAAIASLDEPHQHSTARLLADLFRRTGEPRISELLRSLYPLAQSVSVRASVLEALVGTGDRRNIDFVMGKLSTPPDSTEFLTTTDFRVTSWGGRILELVTKQSPDPRYADIVTGLIEDQMSTASTLQAPRSDLYTLCGVPAYTLIFLDERALPLLDQLSASASGTPIWSGPQAWSSSELKASVVRAAALIRMRYAKDLPAGMESVPSNLRAYGAGRLLLDRYTEDDLEAILADENAAPAWAIAVNALINIHDRQFEDYWRARTTTGAAAKPATPVSGASEHAPAK